MVGGESRESECLRIFDEGLFTNPVGTRRCTYTGRTGKKDNILFFEKEKESEKAVVEPQKEKATGKPKYKPVEPVTLETVPEDAVFIRSTDVCKLLNISNSTLRNMRAEHAIPFYKLGGIFLYSKEEIMNYLASNYSRRI